MRVTHIVESLGRGGLERMVIDLAECQVSQGESCQIICLFTAGELFEEAINKNIKCVVCNKKNGLDLAAMFRIRKAINNHKPDVIHTHNAVANYYAYYATFGKKIRCIVNTRHGMGSNNPRSKREKNYKKSVCNTDYVVAVCDEAKSKLIDDKIVPNNKCIVINNGIKVIEFSKIAQENINKNNICNDSNRNITIGTIGRLNWAKDIFTLLDVFQLLKKKYDNIDLVIAGGGDLKGQLIAYTNEIGVSKNVTFLGDTENVKPVLSMIDIFVSTSVSEGYSIALLEACASGIPIVATDVGGNAEIITNNINGYIVSAKDKISIADHIDKLINSKEIREKYSKNGLAWVKKFGDIETMSHHYSILYKKCLDK